MAEFSEFTRNELAELTKPAELGKLKLDRFGSIYKRFLRRICRRLLNVTVNFGHIQKETNIIVKDCKGGGASRTASAAFVVR